MLSRPRVIATLLLAAIAWGSTVEFTHHHGASSAQFANQQFAGTNDVEVKQASIESQQSSHSSSRSNTSECSICQLHHNLATTLISKLADAKCEVASLTTTVKTTAVHLSEFTATRRGRAPPALL